MNSTLTVQTVWKYTDEDGQAQSLSSLVTVPYTAQLKGALDVPALEAMSTVHAIPFGSIAKATALEIVNNTDQDLTLKINGSLALLDIPPGGTEKIVLPALPAGTALTAASLTTTAAVVLGGTIKFKVFGDPV